MKISKTIVAYLFLVFPLLNKVNAQNKIVKANIDLTHHNKLKAKVEANPSSLEGHRVFIGAFDINNPKLEMQYKIWMKRFPKIYAVPYAIGEAYAQQKNPKAIPFLLRASIIKPNNGNDTWNLLKGNSYFTNDLSLRQKYIKEAMNYDPTNADYAYDYARSFQDTDPVRSDSLYLDVARRFPNSESGADALLILAVLSDVPAEKVAYYRQLQDRKANKTSSGYLAGMTKYFDLLLNTNLERAFELGLSMVLEDKLFQDLWNERLKVVTKFIRARKLLTEGQPKQALALLNLVVLDNDAFNRHIDAKETLALFKAEAADADNQTKLAYDSLAMIYSKTPSDRINAILYKYGCKLGLDSSHVDSSILKIRYAKAKKAKDFHLENYLSAGKSSLSDYAGKVVLLTYWFPACTPCRVEFPHFESVIKKFNKNDVAYLGLNLQPSEDSFVLPFLKETGYSFTPLHDDWKRDKGNLKEDGAPTNYLIDQKGRIVFSGFRIDANNERTLELMIKELLAVKDR